MFIFWVTLFKINLFNQKSYFGPPSTLETLEKRRDKLSLKFALKAEKHQKFKKWFKLNEKIINTRNKKPKYCEVKAKLQRFKSIPIAYLTKTRLNPT